MRNRPPQSNPGLRRVATPAGRHWKSIPGVGRLFTFSRFPDPLPPYAPGVTVGVYDLMRLPADA